MKVDVHLQDAIQQVSRTPHAVWMFGSRAHGCASPTSDWDVLICDPSAKTERREQVGHFDLVCVPWKDRLRDRWLGGELATHVAQFGVRLHGDDDWTHEVDVASAFRRKLDRTRSRAFRLESVWPVLAPNLRAQRATRLSRDLIRLWWLKHEGCVPPTALIDDKWSGAKNPEQLICRELDLDSTRTGEFVRKLLLRLR